MQLVAKLAHIFLPGKSNNHRAKILHNSSILIISVLLIGFQLVLQFSPFKSSQVLGFAANIPSDEVIRLTNKKRVEAGVAILNTDTSLNQAALLKGNHMISNNYWAHVAPDGTEPWKFFADVGYKYRFAGENLARDFMTAQATVDAWMASPSHKENLLSDKYKDVGVAVVEGKINGEDATIIVQLFGTKLSDVDNQIPVAAAKQQISPTSIPNQNPTQVPVSPTLSPVPTPTGIAPVAVSTGKPPASGLTTLFSPFQQTKGISIAVTGLLIVVMAVDALVVTRKRIKRIGGRTAAHLAFLGMVLLIIIVAKAGRIL